jgi:hypothetical protein
LRKKWAGKAGLIRKQGPWKGVDDVEYTTLEWVGWFNNRRLLEPISNIPPAKLEESAIVALLKLNSLRSTWGDLERRNDYTNY